MGAEWVVDVEVVVMAMQWCAWSGSRKRGLQLQHPTERGPLAPSGDGPVAAFDQACAGDGGGGD